MADMTTNGVERVPLAAWRMLALGVAAQATGTFVVSTPAFLIPMLHLQQGLSLADAGLLAAAPTFGMVLTLVAWGALADRIGERWVIAGGLALTAVLTASAASTSGFVALGLLLVLAGAASASTNSASGRIVVGWFPRRRRGLAMGIRQMSQPLGVALAAIVVPTLAENYGIGAPLLAAAIALAVLAAACSVAIANPPRPTRASAPTSGSVNPYRNGPFLVRIHAVSVLLVIPQFTLSTFGLVWLVGGLEWNATAAGVLIAVSQFIGALGRIVVGSVSDRVATRVGVLRWVAVSCVGVMLLLAGVGELHWSAAAAVMLILASTVTVADNGLAFTSVAEAAGPAWAGRALGIQNTGQFVAASAVGPGIGALIALVGYPLTFALVAFAPLASLGLIPKRDQHWG
ncbi:sugar phosphate permease [Microbacterium halimionae]|uniref:Sugar phosphate permease n=1 Tax=Microbacterium halimionae TaxID=1526413 RepID=A0A7W3PML0_9MICO|nr:MFS transporter [Microbacterium halimionae]MBA8817034.1 sugar phosphate permease [Microbacterium halimionae]NII94427.1 sugar phosphate permease [Microbacterium halimionae]